MCRRNTLFECLGILRRSDDYGKREVRVNLCHLLPVVETLRVIDNGTRKELAILELHET